MADAERVPGEAPTVERFLPRDQPWLAESMATGAVFALRLCNPGLTEADAIELFKEHFQRISTRHSARTEHDQPCDATSADTRPTAAAHSQTPAAGAPPAAPLPSPPASGTADIFRDVLCSLSEEERNRRQIKAAELGAVDELRALLAAGTDVGAKAGLNRTALHWAAMNGHVDAARSLVEAGAPVNDKDNMLQTPLHYAAFNGHAAVVRLLAASGADIDARNMRKETALHWAASLGHAEAAAALLEAGANKELKGYAKHTPLDLARRKNQQKLIELLS